MGDTFDRVMEVAVESKSKEICSFVIEYYNLFPESKFIKNGMVVVAQPEAIGGESGSGWEGKVGALKVFIRQLFEGFEKDQKKADQRAKDSQAIAKKQLEEMQNQMAQ